MPTSVPDCPFCEIVERGDPDVREVCRNDDFVVFFPLEPATIGHTLIVPREHLPTIWDLPDRLARELGSMTVEVSRAVRRAMKPGGLNVIQSNGAAATQTVMHLHVHVVPRWEGDSVGRIWPPETSYPDSIKDEAWELIRAECRTIT